MSNDAPTLFRPEVLAERKAQWLGTVLLVPKLWQHMFAVFAAATAACVLALLFFASYPRKVRVTGWLAPQGGLVEVFTPQTGVATSVDVKEGAHVKKGDRLVAVSSELQSAALGATGEQVTRQLMLRKESLLSERRNLERLAEQQKRSLSDRLDALDASEDQLGSEIALQNARTQSASRTVTRQKALAKEGLASAENVQSAEEGQIEQATKIRELARARLQAKRDRLSVQAELDDLPIKSAADIAAVDRNIAAVEQELAETAAQREIVITAPESGVATAVQVERGGHPDPKVPLVSIVPDGTKLEAHLLTSGRAVGFLKPGQRVLLRYDAFPYQKFGHYEGTITSVSHAAISPNELPPQAAGFFGVEGSREPVYRVTVALAAQDVKAYGRDVPLQAGMQVEADVVLETRRLVEWMLEPLFTVSGSWKR